MANTYAYIKLGLLSSDSKFFATDTKNPIHSNLEIKTNNDMNKISEKTFGPQKNYENLNRKKHKIKLKNKPQSLKENTDNEINLKKKISDQENRKTSSQNHKITSSIFEIALIFIKKIFCKPLTKKEKLIEISKKRFQHEIDITYILEKIQQFERLKMLVLNKTQLKAFNLLYKPFIYLPEDEESLKESPAFEISKYFSENSKKNQKMEYFERKEKLNKYYIKISREALPSKIDHELLKMIKNGNKVDIPRHKHKSV